MQNAIKRIIQQRTHLRRIFFFPVDGKCNQLCLPQCVGNAFTAGVDKHAWHSTFLCVSPRDISAQNHIVSILYGLLYSILDLIRIINNILMQLDMEKPVKLLHVRIHIAQSDDCNGRVFHLDQFFGRFYHHAHLLAGQKKLYQRDPHHLLYQAGLLSPGNHNIHMLIFRFLDNALHLLPIYHPEQDRVAMRQLLQRSDLDRQILNIHSRRDKHYFRHRHPFLCSSAAGSLTHQSGLLMVVFPIGYEALHGCRIISFMGRQAVIKRVCPSNFVHV